MPPWLSRLERFLGKEEVPGSNPGGGFKPYLKAAFTEKFKWYTFFSISKYKALLLYHFMHRLKTILRRIDGRGYKAYKLLEGKYDYGNYALFIDP